MRTFNPRLETLPVAQQTLWASLVPTREMGLVLYGGTAIALRLGHRISVDFDFFTEATLDKDTLREKLGFLKAALTLQETPNGLTVLVHSGQGDVKVSFFGSIKIGRVGEPEVTGDGVLSVASLDDLMATKVKVILQRNEAKDYKDVAAMLASGVSLAKGLAAARGMYGPSFQPGESLKALVYFEGGDLDTLTSSEKDVLIEAVDNVRELPEVKTAASSLSI
jgi:hypothetical protein